jgi:hypothetical protein
VVIALLVLGGAAALFTGGGPVGPCLGPIGVTVVQCAQRTGVFPGVGIGIPIFVLAVAVATLVLWPPSRSRLAPTLVAGFLGASLGALMFLLIWPTTLEGHDSAGQFISIPRPPDLNVLVATAIAGALFVGLAASRMNRTHRETP